MNNASLPIIAAATATATARFTLLAGDLPARLTGFGLAGSETVTLSAVDGSGATEVVTPVFKDGSAVTCNPTNPVIAIYTPGLYQVVKSVTAGAAGVFVTRAGG